MRSLLLISLVAVTPTAAAGQAAATRPLRAMTDTTDNANVRAGVSTSAGTARHALVHTTIDGRAAWLVTALYTGRDGDITYDTLAIDAASLAPLWHRTRAPTDSASVTFAARHATGWINYAGKPKQVVDFTLSRGAIDGALLEWMPSTLPLAVGYEVVVPTFSMWDGAEKPTTFRVIGEESIVWRGAPTATWVVRQIDGDNDRLRNGAEWMRKRWVDKATGQVIQTHDRPAMDGMAATDGYWTRRR